MFLDPLGPNFVKLSICVACGHGSVLLRWLCTTLCTSSCQCDVVCWLTPLVRVIGYVLSCPTLRRAPRLDDSFVEWVLGAEYAMFCTIKHLLVTSCRRAVCWCIDARLFVQAVRSTLVVVVNVKLISPRKTLATPRMSLVVHYYRPVSLVKFAHLFYI